MHDAAVSVVDLVTLARSDSVSRVAWAHGTADLNLNLVVLQPGEAIEEHINQEVDVLLVGIEGEGRVEIGGRPHRLRAGQAVVILRGTSRSIRCPDRRFAYLTCHRRRSGLWPRGIPERGPGQA